MHMPPEQAVPTAQRLPQLPQLKLFVCLSTHAPPQRLAGRQTHVPPGPRSWSGEQIQPPHGKGPIG
jgi:hypothetical protein